MEIHIKCLAKHVGRAVIVFWLGCDSSRSWAVGCVCRSCKQRVCCLTMQTQAKLNSFNCWFAVRLCWLRAIRWTDKTNYVRENVDRTFDLEADYRRRGPKRLLILPNLRNIYMRFVFKLIINYYWLYNICLSLVDVHSF